EIAARGAAEVGVADTIGVAEPARVADLCAEVAAVVGRERLSLHVHDTRGQGVANVLAAYGAGVRRFEGSVGGLGGCPFAPRAAGDPPVPHAAPTAADVDARLRRARAGGTERARQKLAEQGKLPVRERIARLFDPESAFVEDALLANCEADDLPADGVVTGIGILHGRHCAVMANDSSVKAGSWGARTV